MFRRVDPDLINFMFFLFSFIGIPVFFVTFMLLILGIPEPEDRVRLRMCLESGMQYVKGDCVYRTDN